MEIGIKYTTPKAVREFFPGFIGGKEIAQKASDNEITALVKMGNELSRLGNRVYELQARSRRLQEAIRSRD